MCISHAKSDLNLGCKKHAAATTFCSGGRSPTNSIATKFDRKLMKRDELLRHQPQEDKIFASAVYPRPVFSALRPVVAHAVAFANNSADFKRPKSKFLFRKPDIGVQLCRALLEGTILQTPPPLPTTNFKKPQCPENIRRVKILLKEVSPLASINM